MTVANLQNGVPVFNDVNYGPPFRLDLSLAFQCFSEAHIHPWKDSTSNSHSCFPSRHFVTENRHPTIAILSQENSRALVHNAAHLHDLVPRYVVPVRYLRFTF